MRLHRETMGRASSARSTLCARRERDDFAGGHRWTPVRDASRREKEVRPSHKLPLSKVEDLADTRLSSFPLRASARPCADAP